MPGILGKRTANADARKLSVMMNISSLPGINYSDYIRKDGTVALTANWDAGAVQIRVDDLQVDDDLTVLDDAAIGGFFGLGAATGLTIAGGVVTATKSNHVISSAVPGADDLDTINGGSAGDVLILHANAGDTVTVKDGTGNIACAGDFVMDSTDTMLLIRVGANWHELARSNNG